MKISWRYKMVLLMLVAVVGAIAVTWVLNRTFLEDYYLYSKMDMLHEAYRSVEQIIQRTEQEAYAALPEKEAEKENDDNLDIRTENDKEEEVRIQFSEASLLELEVLAVRNNLSVLIVRNGNPVYYSTMNSDEKNILFILDRLKPYMYPGSSSTYNLYRKIKVVDNQYELYEIYDRRTNSNFVELFQMDEEKGHFLLIRTNIESLRENVDIANTFLAYAGMAVGVIVSILLFFATRSFVRPIEELSKIANRMSRLDFDAKYEVRTKDEIGELGQSINMLSERLEETISDLKSANNQLQTDIEQKVQVDEMRKEFLSNVTHELKTPIALIQGYAEGLKDNISEDEESREFYCDVIIDEASKMNKMVKKLLTLNQIEFGNDMVELERFDLVALIRSVVESSEILMKQNGIRLLFDAHKPINVWADEYMIEEVVTNYLTNAVHHAGNEKVVDIRMQKQEKTVRVSVFNTGVPIPEEDVDKIWIKFYKVDKARTREYGGSGIGLSIVKAIMESHNKPYGVINHANGVEFWFELDAEAEI